MIIGEQLLIFKCKDLKHCKDLILFQNNIINNKFHLLFDKPFIINKEYVVGFTNLGVFTIPLISTLVNFFIFLILNLAFKIKFKGKGFLRWVFPREYLGVLLS